MLPSASGASSGSVHLTLGSGGIAGGVGAPRRRSDSLPFPLGTSTLMETAAGTARGAAGQAGGSSDCQKKKGPGFKFVMLGKKRLHIAINVYCFEFRQCGNSSPMSWELIWQTNSNSYLYMCTHQAFGHEIRLGQNPPHQPLGVQVGRHVVAQTVGVLMAGVLGHNDRVDAGVEQPLNGRLSDGVVSQAWRVDPHMVGSPLQDAAKKVFTHWFAGKPNGVVGLLLPVDIEEEWGAGVGHLVGPAAYVLIEVVHGAPGCAVRPGLGCEGPLPSSWWSFQPSPSNIVR